MVFQIKARLVYNKRIKDDYFHCALYAHIIAKEASPGQFVNIKLSDDFVPLLRRPFSIHRVSGTSIEILYEVVGQGTEILSKKKQGEYLDVIGPLGNGFYWQSPGHHVTGSAVLIAGGMGVAPLTFLAEKFREIKNPCLSGRQEKSKIKIIVLIGAKTEKQILCEKEFKKLGCEVKISTDDGSRGFKGKVTELLKNFLLTNWRTGELANSIYACGPRPMLKEISLFSKKHNIPAQISLEEHLACGIGACFGCAINTKQGFKRVCKEGPVFNIDEIIWSKV